MPIYEYSCPKCGEFELTQRITDDPLKKCPTCKSKVRKLISNTSFQLKGSGWYVTDYGGKKAAKDAGAKDSAASSGDGEKSAPSEPAASKAASDSGGTAAGKDAGSGPKKDSSAKAA